MSGTTSRPCQSIFRAWHLTTVSLKVFKAWLFSAILKTRTFGVMSHHLTPEYFGILLRWWNHKRKHQSTILGAFYPVYHPSILGSTCENITHNNLTVPYTSTIHFCALFGIKNRIVGDFVYGICLGWLSSIVLWIQVVCDWVWMGQRTPNYKKLTALVAVQDESERLVEQ